MSTESADLGRHLRTLVEACFEEGQYESGLGLLEQLREQKIKPYPYVPPSSALCFLTLAKLPRPPTDLHCALSFIFYLGQRSQ